MVIAPLFFISVLISVFHGNPLFLWRQYLAINERECTWLYVQYVQTSPPLHHTTLILNPAYDVKCLSIDKLNLMYQYHMEQQLS